MDLRSAFMVMIARQGDVISQSEITGWGMPQPYDDGRPGRNDRSCPTAVGAMPEHIHYTAHPPRSQLENP
jgi:hypothetical protein